MHTPELVLKMGTVSVFRLSISQLNLLQDMNHILFHEDRIINSFEKPDLTLLLLQVDGIRAGFKVGYGLGNGAFYSAKGGVMPVYRRRGFARLLTIEMMKLAQQKGYRRFEFDTFPNKGYEMLVMALSDGFKVTDAGWNEVHNDFRIHLSVSISEYLSEITGLNKNDAG
jgi:GNAT superfamily N-acetyltransferase